MRFLHKNKFAFLRAMFRLLRFGNLLMIGFTQYLVKIFFIDTHTNHFWEHFADQKFLAISSSTILVAAAGYIVNDYYDIKIDLINKPNEVVVGKLIRRRIALAANFTLNFLAITLAWYVSWQITIFVFFCIFLLWLYSNRLKRMPLVGNLAIAFLSAATIWIVALYYDQHWEEIYVYTFFAFFISLIREIIKDIEDMKGDAMFNCRTIPIIWGVPRTKKLLYVLIIIFFLNLFVSFFFLSKGIVVFLSIILIFPSSWLIYKLYKADKRKDFKWLSSWAKIIMLLGILSIFFVDTFLGKLFS